VRTLFVILLLAAAGCSSNRVIPASQVKAYGTDPLQHTTYTGTDDQYHHFSWQRDFSRGRWRVPKDETRIEPPDAASGFVQRVEPGVIHVLVLRIDPTTRPASP
jgi:hypothetical protein